jgi:cyclopropane-fatty-acyl-phospholipid synthase
MSTIDVRPDQRTPPRAPRVVTALRRALRASEAPAFELETADGVVHRIGGTADGPVAFRIRVRTSRGLRALLTLDETAIGEAYMEQDLDFEGDFLAALDLRRGFSDAHPLSSLWRFLQPLLVGRIRSDRGWVARHYDHGDDFYFAFLDRDVRLYSQALYRSEDETLEQAVRNKLDYVARACRLGPGTRVLDVGAGWGSFAGWAAARGVDVDMLTISPAQYAHLTARARENPHPGRLRAFHESVFAYAADRPYDAIVLLGVMEHLPDYARLFARFDALLRPDGRLYMDFAAGRKKFAVSAFTYRHVFPGAHTPVVLPELLAAANQTRFEPVALHNDRHSYYLTLQAWARNLEAARDRIVPRVGERTYRLFQIYLWAGAHQMQRDGALESYRVLFQRSLGAPSSGIGVDEGL